MLAWQKLQYQWTKGHLDSAQHTWPGLYRTPLSTRCCLTASHLWHLTSSKFGCRAELVQHWIACGLGHICIGTFSISQQASPDGPYTHRSIQTGGCCDALMLRSGTQLLPRHHPLQVLTMQTDHHSTCCMPCICPTRVHDCVWIVTEMHVSSIFMVDHAGRRL